MAVSKNKCVHANAARCKLEDCLALSPCKVWVPDEGSGLLPVYHTLCLSDGDSSSTGSFQQQRHYLQLQCRFPDGSGGWKAVAVILRLSKIVLFSLWSLQRVWCVCWIWEVKGSFWGERSGEQPKAPGPQGMAACWGCSSSLCTQEKAILLFFHLGHLQG